MKVILESLYLKDDVVTLRGCYQRMLQKHYTYLDGEGRRYLKVEGEYPSEQQFRYFAKKILPEETVIRRRKGDSVLNWSTGPKQAVSSIKPTRWGRL